MNKLLAIGLVSALLSSGAYANQLGLTFNEAGSATVLVGGTVEFAKNVALENKNSTMMSTIMLNNGTPAGGVLDLTKLDTLVVGGGIIVKSNLATGTTVAVANTGVVKVNIVDGNKVSYTLDNKLKFNPDAPVVLDVTSTQQKFNENCVDVKNSAFEMNKDSSATTYLTDKARAENYLKAVFADGSLPNSLNLVSTGTGLLNAGSQAVRESSTFQQAKTVDELFEGLEKAEQTEVANLEMTAANLSTFLDTATTATEVKLATSTLSKVQMIDDTATQTPATLAVAFADTVTNLEIAADQSKFTGAFKAPAKVTVKAGGNLPRPSVAPLELTNLEIDSGAAEVTFAGGTVQSAMVKGHLIISGNVTFGQAPK